MNRWLRRPLSELLRPVERRVAVAELDEVPWAGVRWYAGGVYRRPTETSSDVKTKTLSRLELNDIVYNRMWATKAAFGVVARDSVGCLVTGDFPVFVVETKEVDPAFMRAVFQTSEFQDEASARAVGTTERRRLKEPDFLAIRVATPSLPEQRRVIDIMAKVEAQVEALTQEQKSASQAYTALLEELALAHPHKAIGSVVISAHAGGTPSRRRPDFYGGNIPWLKSGEVDNDQIGTTEEFITDAGLKGSSAKMVLPGSTVVAMYGQGDTKGRAGFIQKSLATNQAVLALTPDESKIRPRLLLHAVRSQTGALRRRAVGAAQPNLSKGLVLSHEIPVPDDLDSQQTIADAADALTRETASLASELRKLSDFRLALLSSLFNQAIEIPESYDALLAEVT